MWAGGSLALDAYEPGRSDVDVAAVVACEASPAEKDAVVGALRHEALPCPARGLELVLYRLDAVATPSAAAAFELNLNTGRAMPFRADTAPTGEDFWFPLDRAILREAGVPVRGPAPAAVFGEIPRPLVLGVLVQAVRGHMGGDARGDDAVLNAARALRFAREGTWASKPAAGAWLVEGDDAPPVVAAALRARGTGEALDPAAVRAFLESVVAELEHAV